MNAPTLPVRVPQGMTFPALVVGTIALLILPLPSWMVDVGLVANLGLTLVLLITAVRAQQPLDLSSFPTLLLFTTMVRLALNVSTTRLALSEGSAGRVVEAFGELVVRGDHVVGFVVFAIITLVQLLVVSKGAERVSEVSARFALDAMPGKQMSIDADLRAGSIDQEEARDRREGLELESRFFGAMDGAMKFVKGDVIAGLLIVFVNLIGGTLVGAFQQGLPFGEALKTYCLLAVGDGLASQIPSLCIAVAAGMVVTRVGSPKAAGDAGSEIPRQLLGRPEALFLVGVVLLTFAAVPLMPAVPFIVAGAGILTLAAWARHRASALEEAEPGEAPAAEPAGSVEATVGCSPLSLRVHPSFAPFVESGRLAEVLAEVRAGLYERLGVRAPVFRVALDRHLAAGRFELAIDEIPSGEGESLADCVYVSAHPAELGLDADLAVAVVDPVTGRTCTRLPADKLALLKQSDLDCRDAAQTLGAQVTALLERKASALLGVQEVHGLLEELEGRVPALVREASGRLPLAVLTEVLRRLVEERVAIRNLRLILEAVCGAGPESDLAALVERCRAALRRQISHQYAPGGTLYAYLVDPRVEDLLRRAGTSGMGLDPVEVGHLLEAVGQATGGRTTVALASPDVRRPLRQLLETSHPELAVLTHAELAAELEVRPLGRLGGIRAAA